MLSRLILIIAVGVLAVTGSPVESSAASARKQCIKQTCKQQRNSSMTAFKGRFGTSKAGCTELKGKERRQCKKAAKKKFGQDRKRCKAAFRDCKKCCKGGQIAACSVAVCGDGVRVLGEECDGLDDSACPARCQADCTCSVAATATLPPITTTTSSSTTTTTLRSGSFVDIGDGTIRDESTGLQWEKKDEAGGIHDVDNWYRWAGCCGGDCSPPWKDSYCQPNAAAAAACSVQTGGAVGCSECSVGTCETWGSQTIWEWIVQVNAEGGSGFAGHSDWRLPSQEGCNSCWEDGQCPCEPAELESILLALYRCGTSPCIDPIFGPTASGLYWSSSTYTYSSSPTHAWLVNFIYGHVFNGHKPFDFRVRAVRGGL